MDESKKFEKIFGDIITTAAEALKAEKISRAELSLISTTILKMMKRAQTREQVVAFIGELASHWDIFEPLYTLQKHEDSDKSDEKAAEEIKQLIKSSKIDEAVEKGKEAVDGR